MSAPCTPVAAVARFTRLSGRCLQQVTSLTWRGWTVYVVDDAAVTVPTQEVDGKSVDELAAVMRSAYSMITVGDRTSGPTTGLRRVRAGSELAVGVAEVCSAAADISGRRTDPDVYGVLKHAWVDQGMAVPFAAVLQAVRHALGESITLTEFGERADATATCELLGRAAVMARGRRAPRAITA